MITYVFIIACNCCTVWKQTLKWYVAERNMPCFGQFIVKTEIFINISCSNNNGYFKYLIFEGNWLQRVLTGEEVDLYAVEQLKGELQRHSCLKKKERGHFFTHSMQKYSQQKISEQQTNHKVFIYWKLVCKQ